MLKHCASLLPSALRAVAPESLYLQSRAFKAVADVEINLQDRETLKKYVGVRDHLSKEAGTKGRFIQALKELLDAVKTLPEQSDYRKAVEATSQYRLKVRLYNGSAACIMLV